MSNQDLINAVSALTGLLGTLDPTRENNERGIVLAKIMDLVTKLKF